MSVPKCLFFFQDLEGLTEVFGRMSAGISGQKLPLWAEFSFLISGTFCPGDGLVKRLVARRCYKRRCTQSIQTGCAYTFPTDVRPQSAFFCTMQYKLEAYLQTFREVLQTTMHREKGVHAPCALARNLIKICRVKPTCAILVERGQAEPGLQCVNAPLSRSVHWDHRFCQLVGMSVDSG